MKKILVTFGLVSILCACASPTYNSAPESPGISEPKVYGVWVIPDDGHGSYGFGHYAFTKHGRKCTVLYEVLSSGVETTVFSNRWEKNGDVITLTYGPNTSSISEGYSSKSRILKLSSREMTYEIMDSDYANGIIERTYRLEGIRPERICALVDARLSMINKLKQKVEPPNKKKHIPTTLGI